MKKRFRSARGRRPIRQSPPSSYGSDRYNEGYERGYTEGLVKGRDTFHIPFQGTSIIIPTYNQAEYLIQCIGSIEAHTPEPHEIIVVDNASTDDIASCLKPFGGKIRFARQEQNRGFAGGVNYGIMMAKGETVVILNNDILVTPNWLTHMLRCLDSDPQIGAVGPVTNYISGEQQIPVPYEDVKEMWEFAAGHNVPDEGKWREADRLVGFCLLLHRDVLHRIGYLDEGYRIGNYEDDDWIIRLRLTGRKLFIAGDSFIHHFGSVSMKQLGQQFESVHHHNELYYTNKWDNPYAWVTNMKEGALARFPGLRSGHDFYPSHVLVRDQSGLVYFLLNGRKYALSGGAEQVGTEAVLLSRLDIRQIPDGEYSLTSEQIREMLDSAAMDESLSAGEAGAGQLVEGLGGRVYQWSRGTLRPFASLHTLERWHMALRKRSVWQLERLNSVPEGDLIIAPPHLDNPVL
ncbi:glycosyltransferase family 2 protein [Paenibacillus sp. Y412MC10]|uniref:glycosyltransferase family 2 protein n=1 Tax=Geobacillus sp. (strain Y412MC10) TaxID=481743 RepID=UPI00164347D4|nr:glycosyltransferase family 2 protein [Paenibacillus sp. Y412MC10]